MLVEKRDKWSFKRLRNKGVSYHMTTQFVTTSTSKCPDNILFCFSQFPLTDHFLSHWVELLVHEVREPTFWTICYSLTTSTGHTYLQLWRR